MGFENFVGPQIYLSGMAALVVTERHLWLNLMGIMEKDII
jgi:hypothetical protein